MKIAFLQFLSIALIIVSHSLYAQDAATVRRVKGLVLDSYIKGRPTYTTNSNYIIYEYWETRKIIYADIPSFKILAPQRDYSGFFAMDKNGIYFKGELFKMDTTGFKFIGERRSEGGGSDWLWKTNQKVFKNNIELKYIDAQTFTWLNADGISDNNCYFKDKNAIYYYDKKLENSDPGTGIQHAEFAYDKNNIYREDKLMHTYSGKKLQSVNSMLVKTSDTVFNFRMQSITKIDAPTLKALTRYYSIDKNQVYFDTVTLPVKPENFKNIRTWEFQNFSFITDGFNVYQSAGYLQSDLDAKTFAMVPNSDFYYDKNGIYKREWFEYNKTLANIKIPFNYTQSINSENTFFISRCGYLLYLDEVYDPYNKRLHTNISVDKIGLLKKGGRFVLNGDDVAEQVDREFWKLQDNYFSWRPDAIKSAKGKILIKNTYYFKDDKHVYFYPGFPSELKVLPGADPSTFEIYYGFEADKKNIYFNNGKSIGRKHLQLLAIYDDRNGGVAGGQPVYHFFLFQNKKGFWLIEHDRIDYLGKRFNPKLNKEFEKLEFAKD